jgi:D-alanine-D-alanine ligase
LLSRGLKRLAMRDKKVGVLLGGLSAERDVSLKTGQAVYEALLDRGYDARLVFVDRDLDKIIRQSGIEVAFIALHGRFGEDGCVQGMLELMGIPYTGSSVLASSLAMHKVKAKELFRLHNVPTPPYYVVSADQLAELEDVHGSFGYPAVVKPVTEGSSVGVAITSSLEELEHAVSEALAYDDQVLVERYAKGKEVSVAVLDGRVLGAVEIQPNAEFYDYDAKYRSGGSQYFIPARLSQPRYQGVLNLARKAALALGCSAVCRVDLIVTEGDNEYVLEVNTLPGMTPTSLVPKLAAAAGMDFGDLCESILHGARLHVSRPAPKSLDLSREDATAWESRARMLA